MRRPATIGHTHHEWTNVMTSYRGRKDKWFCRQCNSTVWSDGYPTSSFKNEVYIQGSDILTDCADQLIQEVMET